jgi:hypothetical protein
MAQHVEDAKREWEKQNGIKRGDFDTYIMTLQFNGDGKKVRDVYNEVIHIAYCKGKILTK